MNNLENAFQKSNSYKGYFSHYIDYLHTCLSRIDLNRLEEIVNLFEKSRKDRTTIYFIGNGGSASTCSHFANDFTLIARGTEAVPFKAVSLCDNNALTTAIANDFGYENLFVEQIKALADKGDILVAISASGNSKNLIHAIQYANKNQLTTVGFAGFGGGNMVSLCQYFLHIPSQEGEYGPVEDVTLILDHVISSYLTYKIYGGQLGFRPHHAGYAGS